MVLKRNSTNLETMESHDRQPFYARMRNWGKGYFWKEAPDGSKEVKRNRSYGLPLINIDKLLQERNNNGS